MPKKMKVTQDIVCVADLNEMAAPDIEIAELQFKGVLDAIFGQHWRSDPNMVDTPRRVIKMYATELFAGCFEPAPDVTNFATPHEHNALQVIGPITFKSTCAHHFQNITGVAYIGVLPGISSPLPGLSKYSRMLNWLARRPTIQEDLVESVADYIVEKTKPAGLAVRIVASHGCCSFRGVSDTDMRFTTTALRGRLCEEELKKEFLSECNALSMSK